MIASLISSTKAISLLDISGMGLKEGVIEPILKALEGIPFRDIHSIACR